MKKVLAKIFSGGWRAPFWISLSFVAAGAAAVPLQEARVSQVIQDVRLLEAHAAPRPAVVNDKVIFGSAVRTGVESRTELTFNDLTITRLGANTIFSFTAGARQAELTQGAILLQVPPNAAPVRANTTAITVAVTGGTALLATGPPTKFMVLEGIGTIYPRGHPEKAATVHGGEMVIASANGRISNPEKFDVKLVLETSPLILDFPPLANLPLILAVVDQQLAEQQLARATTRPLARNFIDVIDVTDQNANANPIVVEVRTETPTPSPTITPPPTPSKFGTPSTIALPNPYVITSGTVITTDPSITTNGVTDYGKIYRDPTDDGAFSLWAFGSTSAFDTALGIDNFFADPNRFPIAAFKFLSLSLIGDPTIDTSNGVTKLALIGVNGITSGPPGGTLTFTGLDLLALGTVNGSINLTSDVSFQNLNELAMYARGAGSNVILNSPISNIGTLELAAEGSIQLTNPGTMSVGDFETTAGDNLTLQIGGSLLLNGSVRFHTLVLPGTTVANGANLTLNVTGDYTNSSATEFSRLSVTNEGAHIGTGGNIAVSIGGDLTAMSDFDLVVQNTNGQIDNGGNITVMTNGSISTGGEFSLLVENYNETANPAGHIGTGGNISLTTGGNLTADFASIAINNRGGGMIDSGVSLTIDIAGALTTMEDGPDFLGNTASLSIAISTRYDDGGGNTSKSFIGGDAALNFHADSASIGGNLFVFLSDRGGTIDGNALLNFNVTHDVTVTGVDVPMFSTAGDIELLNDSGVGVGSAGSPFGGTIHGDATLQVSAANFTLTDPAGSLFVAINNRNGGLIDSNATLSFNLTGNLTTQGGAEFDIVNDQNQSSNGMPGGSIGLAATLEISAANISIGTDFTARILNHRGQNAPGPGAGSIGTNATLNISAGSVAVGGLFDVAIFNRDAGSGSGTGGSIGGNAAINLDLAGNLSAQGNAEIVILNESVVAGSPGGTIVGNATIDVGAGNISTNGTLSAGIYNFGGGSIGGSANLNFNLTGDVTTQSNANFLINSLASGTIGGDALLTVSAVNISTLNGGSLSANIFDNGGGHIGGNANLSFGLSGNLTTQGDASFGLNTGNFGTVTNGAMINVNAASISTGGALFAVIYNNGSGNIGSNAVIDFGGLGGGISTTGEAQFLVFNNDDGNGGGTIGTDANINVSAASITTGGFFFSDIINDGGNVVGNANINFDLSGDLNTGRVEAAISNIGGTIGSDANITFNVGGNITAPINAGMFFTIDNSSGGTINGAATINVNTATLEGGALFNIANAGGIIGSDAIIDVTAGNISTAGFTAEIDNTGGTIGGNATINMSVSGTANFTRDATFQILGSDTAGVPAININGGNYDVTGVGQTFLTYIDGNGTITFNNATAHADVLKVGALGANGTVIIGGGMLSADTTLKLYAGSNGELRFVSNVTLGGSAEKILAANTINILDGVVVTIGGVTPAEVYTTNANYTGFGGNGTTTGTFAGAGANNPLPLNQAPPFGAPPPGHRTNRGGMPAPPQINVSNTADLLALLDGAVVGPDGRITISDSRNTTNLRNLSRINMNGLPRGARRMLINEMRERSMMRAGGRRIL